MSNRRMNRSSSLSVFSSAEEALSAAGAEGSASSASAAAAGAGLAASSAALLGQNGRFYIVYPASRMAELICRLSEARLEPKRLRLVQARADAAPSLVLVEAAKLGKPGLVAEPTLILKNADGTDTEETKIIYHWET